MSNSEDSLVGWFEEQNYMEAASAVASILAMLPSEAENKNICSSSDNNNETSFYNLLLAKEFEIDALKKVIEKWQSRAIEVESNIENYYLDQLRLVQLRHENELRKLARQLDEKDDIISTLKEQVDYLVSNHHHGNTATDSYVSTLDQDDEEDLSSIVSSIYDRDVEQRLTWASSAIQNQNSTSADGLLLKSETILDNIQETMRAIEQELNIHTSNINVQEQQDNSQHRRSTSMSSYYSASTLIDSNAASSLFSDRYTKGDNSKKQSFFIIIKKAFPKLYKQKNSSAIGLKRSTSKWTKSSNSSVMPRRNTGETLAEVYNIIEPSTSIRKYTTSVCI